MLLFFGPALILTEMRGARIKEDKLVVQYTGVKCDTVTVKLSGIRKGCGDIRFSQCTEAQYKSNERFWGQQFTS